MNLHPRLFCFNVLFAVRFSPNKPQTTPDTPREKDLITCSQDLLLQVKQTVDNISDILQSNQFQQPMPTCGPDDQKSQLVSALTGMYVGVFISAICRVWWRL